MMTKLYVIDEITRFDGSIGCEYTYSGPFREAQISVQPLWGFSSSNPDRSQSRAEHVEYPA